MSNDVAFLAEFAEGQPARSALELAAKVPAELCQESAEATLDRIVLEDGTWTVTFASVILGRFDERRHTIHPIAAVSGGRSASCAGSAPDGTNGTRP